jgi:CheY-like chemotaxis protein
MPDDLTPYPPPRGPLVLVVDHELTRRSILGRMIRAFGYSVRCCRSSRDALEFLREHPREVRLLVADLLLPGMDGGELIERALDLDPTVRVLLTVDRDDPRSADLHAGYHDFAWIRKPVTFTALASRLDELFGPVVPGGYPPSFGRPAPRRRRSSGQHQL